MVTNPLSSISDLAKSVPDRGDLVTAPSRALAFVESYEIDDHTSYELAGDELKRIKRQIAALEEHRKSISVPLNNAVKALNDLFRVPHSMLEQAEAALKCKMVAYLQEQQRIEQAERAEQERLAQEQREKLIAEARAAEGEAKLSTISSMVAQEHGLAGEAEEQNRKACEAEEHAAALREEASATSAVVVLPDRPKVDGIGTTTRITFDITNFGELVKHVAQNPDYLNFLKPNESAIRRFCNGLGEHAKLPGVAIYKATSMVVRAKA